MLNKIFLVSLNCKDFRGVGERHPGGLITRRRRFESCPRNNFYKTAIKYSCNKKAQIVFDEMGAIKKSPLFLSNSISYYILLLFNSKESFSNTSLSICRILSRLIFKIFPASDKLSSVNNLTFNARALSAE